MSHCHVYRRRRIMDPNNPSETEITYSIRSLLRQFGIFHFKHWGGPMSEKGVPDIIGCYQGKMLCIEIKKKTGTVSPDQKSFLANVKDAGGIAFVARSIDDVVRELGLDKKMLFPLTK
jgi:VRR-NUC domain